MKRLLVPSVLTLLVSLSIVEFWISREEVIAEEVAYDEIEIVGTANAITPKWGADRTPMCSLRGDVIVYVKDGKIYTQRRKSSEFGQAFLQVRDDTAYEYSNPDWNHDGTQFVFERTENGRTTLHYIEWVNHATTCDEPDPYCCPPYCDEEGGEEWECDCPPEGEEEDCCPFVFDIPAESGYDYLHPKWGPRCEIVYEKRRVDGTSTAIEIFCTEELTKTTLVSIANEHNTMPEWSTQGFHVAYVKRVDTEENGTKEIFYKGTAQGAEERRVTEDDFEDDFPKWGQDFEDPADPESDVKDFVLYEKKVEVEEGVLRWHLYDRHIDNLGNGDLGEERALTRHFYEAGGDTPDHKDAAIAPPFYEDDEVTTRFPRKVIYTNKDAAQGMKNIYRLLRPNYGDAGSESTQLQVTDVGEVGPVENGNPSWAANADTIVYQKKVGGVWYLYFIESLLNPRNPD